LIAALRLNTNPDLREPINRAVARLEELRTNLPANPETIDKSLGDIEEMLNNELLGKTDPAKIKRFERDVNALLRAYRTT
ncbi:hypothetical protein OFB84_34035, partial [Escherichia coli]|nr:hypothetical protein [Escherichia coli]